MKTKLLKSILSLLLISSTVLTLFSCNNEVKKTEEATDTEIITESSEKIETEVPNHIKYDKVKDYQIIKNEKGYYLVFDDISVYKQEFGHDTLGFDIDSLEDFSDKLLKGDLTFQEKRDISRCPLKDDNGVSILNPHITYKISHTLPIQVNYEEIQYFGCGISLPIECEEYPSISPIYITILNSVGYDNEYNAGFEGYTKDEKKIEYEMTLTNGEIVTCYNKIVKTERNQTRERYVLSNGTKDMFVLKTYYKDSTTPDTVDLVYNIDDTVYFEFFESALNGKIPNDEFWFSFDVEAIERT